VGTTLRHMRAEVDLAEAHRTLRAQHQIVQERNITLRGVLATLEEEKREIRSNILANIQRIIMPIVFELELAVTGRQRSYVTLLRQSLQEIASPFYSSLARDHSELTPVEVAISTMIRNGMSTKEIAQLRCISPATVHRHRENIRRKLGLQNQPRNLATYLQGAVNETASDTRQRMMEEPPPSLVGQVEDGGDQGDGAGAPEGARGGKSSRAALRGTEVPSSGGAA
jgi:DNA-binding NarL/FixJ family response regulator